MKIGDRVEKVGGDYTFVGHVRAVFQKASGAERLVVEDDRGVLHIYSAKNLRLAALPASPTVAEVEETVRELRGFADRFESFENIMDDITKLPISGRTRYDVVIRRAASLIERLAGREVER